MRIAAGKSRISRATRRIRATRRLAPVTLLVVAALVLAACGGGGGADRDSLIPGAEPGRASGEVPGNADPGDVRVIDAWTSALARGDVDTAAGYFAIPSVAENGPVLVRIKSLDDARRFNRSLPCGARLIRAETQGDFTTATFSLIERPGPGSCGSGTGHTAATAFVIKGGKIVEWRRVPTPHEPQQRGSGSNETV
jgi:hypothetical protein